MDIQSIDRAKRLADFLDETRRTAERLRGTDRMTLTVGEGSNAVQVILDKAFASRIRAAVHQHLDEAIMDAVAALRALGVTFPDAPSTAATGAD